MLSSVLLKSVRDQRRAMLAWAVGLAVLVAMYVAIYPTVRDNPSYADLVAKMPESVRALFLASGAGDLTTPQGYLYMELLSFMAPLLLVGYAIGAGANAIAGEQERRTLDLVLAAPVDRRRLLLEKFGAQVTGLGFLGVVLWAALLVEGAAVDMRLSVVDVGATVLHLGLVSAEFGALALLAGAATGRLGVARAVPSVAAVAAYLWNALAPLVPALSSVRKLSPFYQYIGHDPIRNGVSVAALLVTLASITVLVVLAAVVFVGRDITA